MDEVFCNLQASILIMLRYFRASAFAACLLCVSLAFSQQSRPYIMPGNITPGDYFQKTIVFKVKPEFRSQCSEESIRIASLNTILSTLGIRKLTKMFPGHQP